jgi:methionyl-tRNA formyltransferase
LGNKGLTALKSLKKNHLEKISYVIIGKDLSILNDYSLDILRYCEVHDIKYCIQNKTFINDAVYSIAIGWRWIIEADINLIVFHDSLLPKYRGFNPLVTALINGDEQIGVTALHGTQNYDTGEIIDQELVHINYPIKIERAIHLIADAYSKLLVKVIDNILSNTLKSTPQNEESATYSLWRDDENYKIDWTQNSDTIKRFIDAVGYPYKGAFTYLEDKKIYVKDAETVKDVMISIREPGKVIFKEQDAYTIVCGQGLLKISNFYNSEGQQIKIDKFRLRFK